MAIDDEPRALEVIEHYASKIDLLDLSKTFTNPLEALGAIKSYAPDLLFLDIRMPDLTGLEFLTLLDKPIPTILVTAYEDYALESYNFLCIDYLLKPVSFPRFVAALEKYKQIHQPITNLDRASESQKILINTGRETVFIDSDNLLFIEADGNYCKIHCTDKKMLVPESLSNLVKLLPYTFSRIHRSFLVNRKAIDRIEAHQVHLRQHRLPIGRKYRDAFRSEMRG